MTVWILNVSCDFHFWSWKKFLLFIHPNDGHVVKSSDYLLENYVMNYSDFPSTLWTDFSSSTMQITTAASPSIPNLASCFILHTQTYTSMCTGIKTCGIRHIWNVGTNIWGEDKICWIKDAYFYITNFPFNYIIFTNNQNQLVAQYSFLFLVRSDLLATFRWSKQWCFQLELSHVVIVVVVVVVVVFTIIKL